MSSSIFTIALATRQDASQIAIMSRDMIETDLPWRYTPARVAEIIKDPLFNVVVARENASPIGFGAMRYGDDDAHLNLLAVDPNYRRDGVGRAMLEWLEKSARTAGIGVISLECRAQNRGALAFYVELGYRRVTTLPGYYQGVEDAVRMSKDLFA